MVTARYALATALAAATLAAMPRIAVARSPAPAHPEVGKPRHRIIRHQPPLVVVDPGHGGKDPGCIGLRGTQEKNVVLATGLALRRDLRVTHRYRVAMTRDRDVFVSLAQRTAFAEQRHAALFVSLHANHSPDRAVRGASIYRFSYRASDPATARLAERENRDGFLRGQSWRNLSPTVTRILSSLMHRETWLLSAALQSSLVRKLKRHVPLLPDPARHASFAVLRAPDIPSVLVEIGFLSNRADESLLRQPADRAMLAEAIADAIESYFRTEQGASAIQG